MLGRAGQSLLVPWTDSEGMPDADAEGYAGWNAHNIVETYAQNLLPRRRHARRYGHGIGAHSRRQCQQK